MRLVRRPQVIITVCVFLGACGGGGGGGSNPSSPEPDAAIGGFYGVQFVNIDGTPGDATLAVAEDGEFHISEDPTASLDGLYIHGSLDVDGTEIEGTGTQIAPPGFVFTLDNGQQVQNLSVDISGRVNSERQNLEGTVTVDGISGQATFDATASAAQQDLYNLDSSLGDIAGRYQDIRTGTNLDVSIAADGSITGNNPNCAISGSVVPIDSRFNLYELSVSVSACPGFVEGAYEGFGSLDEITSNPVLITAGDNGADALFVYIFDQV